MIFTSLLVIYVEFDFLNDRERVAIQVCIQFQLNITIYN